MKSIQRLLCLFSVFTLSIAAAAPSTPKAAPEKRDAKLFAKGTDKLFDLKFAEAAVDFRAALEANPKNAAAHNNLAFVLRKQGADQYDEALRHYNRAIEIEPKLAEAHMYRGVLYTAMNQPDRALQDHARLLELGESALADELEWVIQNGEEKEPAQFFGVVAKADA